MKVKLLRDLKKKDQQLIREILGEVLDSREYLNELKKDYCITYSLKFEAIPEDRDIPNLFEVIEYNKEEENREEHPIHNYNIKIMGEDTTDLLREFLLPAHKELDSFFIREEVLAIENILYDFVLNHFSTIKAIKQIHYNKFLIDFKALLGVDKPRKIKLRNLLEEI